MITGKPRDLLQRGVVAFLWSLIRSLIHLVIRRRRPEALPPAALPPPAPADGIDYAVLVDDNRRTRRSYSRDKMYSPLIVDELIEKLRRQNGQLAFLGSVFKSTSDAVVVADLTGKITMFNKGAENIFELDESMALGDNLFRLCTESTPDGPVISRMLVENKRIENLRSELVGIMGKRTQVLLTVNFVEDEDGQPVAIVAVIKDNSQLEKLLSEVTQKKEEVERLYVEVEKLSVTDEKTGLYNSRYFQRQIADEYERMKRGHMAELSLIVIDIDHFKKFNDTYGHQTGDDVLKAVAEVLKRTVRKIDVPARFGGEEFMVILPATGREGALRLAERIRVAVAELKVPVQGKGNVSVTISLGVRTHSPKDSTVGMFIHEADEAMYRAKQSGRNRTIAFETLAA
jgi:diguanylate cyclase (GGDEF)-like protein/PAS domain S-box-containing protein